VFINLPKKRKWAGRGRGMGWARKGVESLEK